MATPDGVCLEATIEIDAVTFAKAIEDDRPEEALCLYRGDFFCGYAAPGAEGFEDWVDLERRRYRALYVHLAETVARRSLNSGRYRDVIATADRLRELDPFGEKSWHLRLEARIAMGDVFGARGDAAQFEEWLHREERHPDITSAALLNTVKESPLEVIASAGPAELKAELVSREDQFGAIFDAWIEAKQRAFRFLHIVAESGLGKTRLLMDVTKRLQAAGARVCYLKANSGERDIDFSFIASIAQCLSEMPGARAVSCATVATLVSIDPSLANSFPGASATSEKLESLRVGLALLELISAIADEEPVALLLDDLQWADPQSNLVLSLIAARLKREHVLLVTAARPGYSVPAPADDDSLLRLKPLSLPAVTDFIGSLATLPEADWASQLPEQLFACSKGNPLNLLEGIRACLDREILDRKDGTWGCSDPQTLAKLLNEKDIVRERLAHLAGDERKIVSMLGVAGVPLPLNLIALATKISPTAVHQVIAQLEPRGFMVVHENAVTLAHDIIKETIADRETESERASIHFALGDALARTGDIYWQRRAISHLAAAKQWDVVARTVDDIFRRNKPRQSVTAEIQSLLGVDVSDKDVARVKRALPFLRRFPAAKAVMFASAAGLIMAGGVAWAGAVLRPPESDDAYVVLARADASRKEPVQRVTLDLSRWDVNRALVASPVNRSERWSRWNPHYAPRPGADEWASYEVFPDSGAGEIQLQSAAGNRRRLTTSRGDDRPGSFSPDGKKLVFFSTRWHASGASNLGIIDLSTGAVSRLTQSDGTEESASWSPDGTRIAFRRRFFDDHPPVICTVSPDGSGERCKALPHAEASHVNGWIGNDRLLVHASSRSKISFFIFDLSRDSIEIAPAQGDFDIQIDPAGRWALTHSTDQSGNAVWSVAPASRLESPREISVEGGLSSILARFRTPRLADNYLDSIAVDSRITPVLIGVPTQMIATGWSRTRKKFSVGSITWRSVNPEVAEVDSLGVVVGRKNGQATIEASAGGWRSARITIAVEVGRLSQVASENWNSNWEARWRRFGEPFPIVIHTHDGNWFLNNGDGNFFSGVYSRQSFDASSGLAVEAEVSTPITGLKWQYLEFSLQYPTQLEGLEKWNHRTGYLGEVMDGVGCTFAFPSGEGVRSRKELRLDPEHLYDGRIFRVRIQTFPDGRCGIAINGVPKRIMKKNGHSGGKAFVVFQGSSVETKILIGSVKVFSGVPSDISWRGLR